MPNNVSSALDRPETETARSLPPKRISDEGPLPLSLVSRMFEEEDARDRLAEVSDGLVGKGGGGLGTSLRIELSESEENVLVRGGKVEDETSGSVLA